jgi:C1A family cysteine protease
MRYNKLLCLIPLFCILFTIPLFSYSGEIDDINAAIKAKGAKWVAKENHIFLLSPEERRMRVGVIQDAAVLGQVVNETFYAPAAVPSSYDWRNVSGSNYVTPIRNQGNCGSYMGLAVTAALESNALITFDTPGVELNLSEQIVVSCSGAGSCSGGSPRTASNFLKNTGTNLESCYPYTATNGDCNLACANWQDGAYRIDGWSYVSSGSPPTADALKNAIYTNGPVIAVFDVYNDFFSYHSGVYSYVSGSLAGGHAVLIVGWDDDPPEHIPCFIVKNSWGAGWGESGYFRIAYIELTGDDRLASSSYAYGNAYQAVVELFHLRPRSPVVPVNGHE